jgi:hypothetical protein
MFVLMIWKLSHRRGGRTVEKQRRNQMGDSGSSVFTQRIFRFLHAPRRSTKGEGGTALAPMFEVPEVIRRTDDRANALEKRARSHAQSAIEELKHAQNRIRELENERQLVEKRMSEVSVRMQETVKALKWAKTHIAAAEGRLIQAELRAGRAETRASEIEATMRRIEVAIRTHLLRKRPEASRKLTAAA